MAAISQTVNVWIRLGHQIAVRVNQQSSEERKLMFKNPHVTVLFFGAVEDAVCSLEGTRDAAVRNCLLP